MAVIVYVVTHILGFCQPLYADEYVWVHSAIDQRYLSYHSPHPPLAFIFQNLSYLALGRSALSLRISVAIIGLVNLFLVYYLANKHFNWKVANISVLILATSSWLLAGTLQLDNDAFFVSLFFLLSTLFYSRYLDNNKSKNIYLTGLFTGLGILSKYTCVLIIPIIILHNLVRNKDLISTVKIGFVITLVALLVFSLFPLAAHFANSDNFFTSLTHSRKLTVSYTSNLFPLLIQLLNAIVWIGPLLSGTFLLYLMEKKIDSAYKAKFTNYFFIWTAVVIFFFLFVNSDPYRPIERYLLAIAPPLSILSAHYLSKQNLRKKHIFVGIFIAVVLVVSFMFLTRQSSETVDFYPKSNFINKLFGLDFSFLIPIQMSSGPQGFYVNFIVILFCFLISLLSLSTHLIMKFKKQRKLAVLSLTLFLAVSSGYSLFMMEEYLFSFAGQDINKVTFDMIDYAKENKLQEPVYIFRNKAMDYYLIDTGNYTQTEILDFEDEFNTTLANSIVLDSTIIILDFPQINKQSPLWITITKNCRETLTFEDKGYKLGYIFECN